MANTGIPFVNPGGQLQVVAGAAVSTITFSNLNGDIDVAYEIFGVIKVAAVASIFSVQPNAISTNQLTRTARENNAGAFNGVNDASMMIVYQATSGQSAPFEGRLMALRGGGARGGRFSSLAATAATTGNGDHYAVEWQEDTTNVTSLVFNSSVASGFGVGSWIFVRPVAR